MLTKKTLNFCFHCVDIENKSAIMEKMEVSFMEDSLSKRLAKIRETLGLSQEELGSRIGISRFSVSNYESGKRNITERVMKDICREFSIDYLWFTTGQGEMLHVSDNALEDRIEELLEGENETAKALFKAFAAFDESDWKTVQKFIDALKKDGTE